MKKISILTPVYQAEKFIQNYLDNVLQYNYRNIQLIIINDNSTDRTEEIIKNNSKKFKHIDFTYIKLDENKGAAAAINVGLKYVNGEYLTWQDVDDIYYPDCLTKSLNYLLKNPECKMVFSKAGVVLENDINKIISYIPSSNFKHNNLFIDYIKEKNVIFGPMRFVETKALFDVLKNKSIYESKSGQNWQLLLPMSYFYQWGYINEILSIYVIHKNSHSHSNKAYYLWNLQQKTLLNTIERMNIDIKEKKKYFNLVRIKYLRKYINSLLKINISLKQKIISISSFGFGIMYSNKKWSIINE